jgi:hypothetical protein
MMPTIPARNANLDLQTLMPEVTKQITRGTSTQREQEVCNLSANGDMSANGNIPDGDDDGGAVDELIARTGSRLEISFLRSSSHFDDCDARKAMHEIL